MAGRASLQESKAEQISQHLYAERVGGSLVLREHNNRQNINVIFCDNEIIDVYPYNNHFFIIVDRMGTIYRVNIESEIPEIKVDVKKVNIAEIPTVNDFILKVTHLPTSPYLVFNFRRSRSYEEREGYDMKDTEYLHIYDVSSNQFYGLHFDSDEMILDICLIQPAYIAIQWEMGNFAIYKFNHHKKEIERVFNIPKVTDFLISPCQIFLATFHVSSCQLWDMRNGRWEMLLNIQRLKSIKFRENEIEKKEHFTKNGLFYCAQLTKKDDNEVTEILEVDLKRRMCFPSSIFRGPNPVQRLPLKDSKHIWNELLADWFQNLLIKIFDKPLPKITVPVLAIIKNYIPILLFDIFTAFPEAARGLLMSQLEMLSIQGPSARKQCEALIEFALLYTCGNSVTQCIAKVKETHGVVGLLSKQKELPQFLVDIFNEIETTVEKNKRLIGCQVTT